MRKIYLLTLTFGLAMFSLNNANAQDWEWPDLGEAMVIEPGAPGVINTTIAADTASDGSRLHNHYILKRGATYLYTGRINNDGWSLMVTAEDGDGALPIIKALGPAPGEDEAERIFHAQGDLYIKDLTLSGWDQGDNFTDNATIRLAADSITVICKNIEFAFNRQNSHRNNAVGCSLLVEDCLILDQGYGGRFTQGFALSMRGNNFPVIEFRNNTIVNMNHGVGITGGSPAIYNKLVFENNTIVNTGSLGFEFGRPDSLIYKNNLHVNIGVLGDGAWGDRDNFAEPYYFFQIDSNFTDTTNTVLKDPSLVDFDYNHFYLDPAVAELLPDSSDKSTETMLHPYLASLAGDNNVIADEAFSFTSFDNSVSDFQAYIDDFYNFAEERANLPQFKADYTTFDFAYSESHAAYSAASDGGPLGDRRWFPNYVGINNHYAVRTFDVFPNPVNNLLRVKLQEDQNVDKIVITNILGQDVLTITDIESKEISINTRNLNNGIYFVNFYQNKAFLGTNKIIKK